MRSLEKLSPDCLDAAIESGLRQLELVARFYEHRGNFAQAEEIRDAIAQMRLQIDVRNKKSEAVDSRSRAAS